MNGKQVFVLVHGAWHGGWCWQKLKPFLQAAGHEVFTPTLTGLGERSHLLNEHIGLSTHIQDVSAMLEYEDLHNVILVGHSYGGMVVAGVASKADARLVHLVYVDAFLPEHGRALADYAVPPPTREDGWRVPPVPGSFDVTREQDIAWLQSRLGDQPYKTFTEPVQVPTTRNCTPGATYIQCTKAPFFAEAGERAKQWGYRYGQLLSAGHDAMITKPAELAELLLEVSCQ